MINAAGACDITGRLPIPFPGCERAGRSRDELLREQPQWRDAGIHQYADSACGLNWPCHRIGDNKALDRNDRIGVCPTMLDARTKKVSAMSKTSFNLIPTAFLAAARSPALSSYAAHLIEAIRRRRRIRRTRGCALNEMPDDMLKDIGVTRFEIQHLAGAARTLGNARERHALGLPPADNDRFRDSP